MLLLCSVTDKIQVITGSAVAVHVQASFVDNNAGTITPGRTNTIISTATTTDVVGSPAASTNRNIKQLTIRAKGGACVVTVQHTDGTTVSELISVSLASGYHLIFTDGYGFEVLTDQGQIAGTGGVSAGAIPTNAYAAVGVAGAAATFIRTDATIPISRVAVPADMKNWTFLGQATASAAVRTGTITWTGTFAELMFEYFISGYSGSAIGRLIVGPTAGLSETGTTFCTELTESGTRNTTSVSVPGWPTAVTAGAVPRYGIMFVKNVAAAVKLMTGHGQHSGTAPTVVPIGMTMNGMFNDTTNLINKAELAVYAAITGAAISATTFNSGTFLNVWGRNND